MLEEATVDKLEEVVRRHRGIEKEIANKPALHLLNKEFLDEVALVRMYGNKKYEGEESWRLAENMAFLDAALRHITETVEAYRKEDTTRLYDPESGLLHLGHAATNLMFIITRIREEGL